MQQHRLGLIVPMVGREDPVQAALAARLLQKRIAGVAGGLLQVPTPLRGQSRRRDLPAAQGKLPGVAKRLYEGHIAQRLLAADAMLQMGRLHAQA